MEMWFDQDRTKGIITVRRTHVVSPRPKKKAIDKSSRLQDRKKESVAEKTDKTSPKKGAIHSRESVHKKSDEKRHDKTLVAPVKELTPAEKMQKLHERVRFDANDRYLVSSCVLFWWY